MHRGWGGSCTGVGDHALEGKGSHESRHEITCDFDLSRENRKGQGGYVCLYSKTSLKKVHFCDDEPFRQTLSSKFVKIFYNKRTKVLRATL